MRKNDLIKLLNALPGNPEVVLWNGFVDDFHHINREIVEVTLVKHSKDFLRWRCRRPDAPELSEEECDKAFKEQEWDFPNRFASAEQFSDWYGKHRKRVYALNGNLRGKSCWDRQGTMSY